MCDAFIVDGLALEAEDFGFFKRVKAVFRSDLPMQIEMQRDNGCPNLEINYQ